MFKITQFPIFVKLLKYAIFIRGFLGMWMHDNKTILLHLETGVITWRKCNNSYFLFNRIKYILCIMYAYFGNFSCPNSTKMAKITWPVSMVTRFKSHKSDTGFWLFGLKDTFCANFIKIGDYRFPRPFGHYRELILSFIEFCSGISDEKSKVCKVNEGRMLDDGLTDRQRVITIVHLSLQLMCTKKMTGLLMVGIDWV